MRFAVAALALPIGLAVSQGVTSAIAPSTSAPAGCTPDYPGKFQIEVVNVTKSSKRDESLQRRADGQLIITLSKGVLLDDQGRTGYIADNQQFQFDGPAQTGAIYTAGWSVCSNGSLAIGGDAIFYQCLSGTFYNLYDNATEEQCSPVYIKVLPYGASSASATAAAAVISDGQVTAMPITQLSDGQPQGPTGKPTAAPVAQTSDGQVQVTTMATSSSMGALVSVISDGQPQVPTGRNSTLSTPTPTASPIATYTGAAAVATAFRGVGLAAGVLALALL